MSWCSEVLTGEGLAPSRATRAPDRLLLLAGAFSLTVHVLVLATFILDWPQRPLPAMPPIEVELIQSQAVTPGDVPQPPQPTPPPQAGTGPTTPPPPPAVNIGNGPEQNDPLRVTGDNIVPPEPDSRFRNQPPGYPPDAARAGIEGIVQLLIRVSPGGVPLEVRVVESSGNQSLDGAARRAVQAWRFRPALEGGRAVAFEYRLNIRFALGDHP